MLNNRILTSIFRTLSWLAPLPVLLAAVAGPARAQPTLAGRWALRQIAFEAPATLPDSLQEKLFHSPAADTNIGISSGALMLVVDFRADSTYTYTTARQGNVTHTEQGTYSVRRGRLFTRSSQAPNEPLFDGQAILELTRRRLQLQSPIWQPELQVFEQLEYQRLPAGK